MRMKTKMVGIVAGASLLAGAAIAGGSAALAAAEDGPASLVEDYSYPGAAAVKESRGIELISGDGRITLLPSCDTTEPKIQIETFASSSEGVYCFAVKGDKGLLKLNVPNVYLVFAGDEALKAKYTEAGQAGEVDIRANGLAPIGADDPDAAVLLELRAGA